MLVVRSRKPTRTASTLKKGCAPSRRDRIGRRPAGVEYPARSARLTRAAGAAHGEARPQAHRGETRGEEDRQRRGGLDPPERVGAGRAKCAAGGDRDDEGAGFEAEGGEREQAARRARR